MRSTEVKSNESCFALSTDILCCFAADGPTGRSVSSLDMPGAVAIDIVLKNLRITNRPIKSKRNKNPLPSVVLVAREDCRIIEVFGTRFGKQPSSRVYNCLW